MPKDRKRKRDEAESASLPSAKKQKRNNSEYSIIDRIVSHITGIPSRSIDDSTTLLHTYIEDNYPKEEIERLFFQDKTADTFISWISSYSYVPNFDSQEVKNWRIQTSVNARDKDGNTP